MDKVGIYSVSDRYISFLRTDSRLSNVFDNKDENRMHIRKYLGIVFSHNDFHYYIPFSSPRASDYIIMPDGSRNIRKSIIPIIRMTTNDSKGGNQPGYLRHTVDFRYAESKCREFDSVFMMRQGLSK